MKKFLVRLPAAIFVGLFLFYLSLPPPSLPPPPIPGSLRSTEEGDTVQIPGVSAYYSDLKRSQVIEFYRGYFSKSSFAKLPLLTIRLNHPPEHARLVIRDQILSSYLEEYVHPFRESLLVNGWEPDVYFADNPDQRAAHQIFVGEKKYFSKTTLRTFESNVFARITIFLLACFLFWLLYRLIIKIKNSRFLLE